MTNQRPHIGSRTRSPRSIVLICLTLAWWAAALPAAGAEPDGYYVAGTTGFLWGTNSTHAWASECPVISPSEDAQAQAAAAGVTLPFTSWAPSCSTTQPLGVTLEGRIGLRFRYIGLEGFLLGSADWSSGVLDGQAPIALPEYAQKMYVGRVGGGPGIGIRFLTKPGPVQFTGGIGGGILARFVYTNISSLDGSSVTYPAPMARVDLSFVFAKHFLLGVMGWAEFSERVKVRPDLAMLGLTGPGGINLELQGLDEVDVFRGTQYFLIPYLGLQFGK